MQRPPRITLLFVAFMTAERSRRSRQSPTGAAVGEDASKREEDAESARCMPEWQRVSEKS